MNKTIWIALGWIALSCCGNLSADTKVSEQQTAHDWEYVAASEPGFPDATPTRLRLKPEKPSDIKVHGIAEKGLLFGQIRYGSPDSIRLVVALQSNATNSPRLFIDTNRDRSITADEQIKPIDNRNWQTQLTAILTSNEKPSRAERVVHFRYGRTTKSIVYRTVGFVQGETDLAGKKVTVRRQDANGNGVLSDKADSVWLDFNSDGRWNAFGEQFPFASLLNLEQKRFAVSSDQLGNRFAVKVVEGTGKLVGFIKLKDQGARVTAVSAVLQGDDGTPVMLQKDTLDQEVPAGRYRLHTVVLSVVDAGNQAWTYSFHRNGGRVADDQGRLIRKWYEVKKDESTRVDILGKVTLDADVPKTVSANEFLRIQPLMFTGDGLLITNCYNGTAEDLRERSCSLVLEDADRNAVGAANTGFA